MMTDRFGNKLAVASGGGFSERAMPLDSVMTATILIRTLALRTPDICHLRRWEPRFDS
jgi:hypothetical protein